MDDPNLPANETRTRSVVRLLRRAVCAGAAPGLVAGWVRAGEDRPTVVAVGRAAVAPVSTVMEGETWFDLASLTKPLATATLGFLLIRDGALSLGTRVLEVLPETAGAPLGDRTVEQLLTHTSGLPAWEPLYCLAPEGLTGLVAALRGLPVGEAGREVVYSCLGSITLALMIERLSEGSLDAVFRHRVVEPLGLDDRIGFLPSSSCPSAGGALRPGAETAMVLERGLSPDLIPPSADRLPDDGNARFLGGVAGNAGLFGTAEGVLGLARIYLEPGFLTEEEIATAIIDRTPGLEQGRGLGWQLPSSPGSSAGRSLAPSAFGHNGFTGTSLWIDPERRVAMTLLSNRNHPGHRLNDLHPLRRRFHQLVIDHVT